MIQGFHLLLVKSMRVCQVDTKNLCLGPALYHIFAGFLPSHFSGKGKKKKDMGKSCMGAALDKNFRKGYMKHILN